MNRTRITAGRMPITGQRASPPTSCAVTIWRLSLHLHGPVSRSELTATTGLNRSTIADLIGELTTLGLVEEGPAVTPSGTGAVPMVSTRPQGAVVLSIELSVDSVAVATVGLGGLRLRARGAAAPGRIGGRDGRGRRRPPATCSRACQQTRLSPAWGLASPGSPGDPTGSSNSPPTSAGGTWPSARCSHPLWGLADSAPRRQRGRPRRSRRVPARESVPGCLISSIS